MTSRSRKKRLTIVRTFIRAIRTKSLQATLSALVLAGASLPSSYAGDNDAGLSPVPPMRTAPQPRSNERSSDARLTNSTWSLRWRKSDQVEPAGAQAVAAGQTSPTSSSLATSEHEPANGAVAEATVPASAQSLSNLLRAARQTQGPAGGVQQVAYTQVTGQATGEGEAMPPRARRAAANAWQDPFGDLPPRSGGLTAVQDSELVPPPLDGGIAVPEPAGEEEPGISVPRVAVPSADEGIAIPGELERIPQIPEPQESLPIDPPAANEGTPRSPFRAEDSPSDRPAPPSIDGGRIPGSSIYDDRAPVAELTCDELRQRIAERTIRKVSLDIAPPFRPDLLNKDNYDRERLSFLENQVEREWRNFRGELIAQGRLINLEYDDAILEMADGREVPIPLSELSEADLAVISTAWGLPTECRLPDVDYRPRNWLPITMTWKASNLCHKPLYFEEVNLERYGHTAGPFAQPVVSTAHFFVNIAVLPYKMGVHPPNECQYALGYYRPGNCAPWIIPPVPLSLRGALFQAGAVGAGIGLIP